MDWSYLTLCILNAYLSNSATMLNIVAIYAIRKTSSLSKNLKTLLLSLAVSDLRVGLLAQPMYVAYIIDSQQNNATNDNNNVILRIPYSGKFLHLCVIVQRHGSLRDTQRGYSSKPLDIAMLNVFQYLNGRYRHISIP